MTELRRVGVIGAGLIGRGIAHVRALAGCAVMLADVSAETLAKAKPEIEANHWAPGGPRPHPREGQGGGTRPHRDRRRLWSLRRL